MKLYKFVGFGSISLTDDGKEKGDHNPSCSGPRKLHYLTQANGQLVMPLLNDGAVYEMTAQHHTLDSTIEREDPSTVVFLDEM